MQHELKLLSSVWTLSLKSSIRLVNFVFGCQTSCDTYSLMEMICQIFVILILVTQQDKNDLEIAQCAIAACIDFFPWQKEDKTKLENSANKRLGKIDEDIFKLA